MYATVPHKRHPPQSIQRKIKPAAVPIITTPTDVPKRRRTAAQAPPKSSTSTSAASPSKSTVHSDITTATSNTTKNPITPLTPTTRKSPAPTRPAQHQCAAVTSTAREEEEEKEEEEDEDEDKEMKTDPVSPPLTGNSTAADRTPGMAAPAKATKTATSHNNTPYNRGNHNPASGNVDHNQTGNQNNLNGHHKGVIPKSWSSGSSEPISAHVNKATETGEREVTEPELQQTPPIVPSPTKQSATTSTKVPTCHKQSPVAPLSTKKPKPTRALTQNHENALNTGRAMGISDRFSKKSLPTSKTQPTKCHFQVGVKPEANRPEPSSRHLMENVRRGTPPLERMTEEKVLRCLDGDFPVPLDATHLVFKWFLDGEEGDISDELYNKASTCLVKRHLNIRKKWSDSKAAAEAKAKEAMEVAEAKTKEAMEAKAKADEARAVAEAKAKAMEAKVHTNIVVKHNLGAVSRAAMDELRHYYMTGTGMVAGSCKILTQLAFSLKEDVMFVFLSSLIFLLVLEVLLTLSRYLVYTGEDQDIYKCFSHLSSAFRESVLRDSGHLKQINKSPHCHILFSEQTLLWTTAFFDWCFGEQWNPNTQKRRIRNTPHFNSSDINSSNTTEDQYAQRLPYSLLGKINHQITGPMTNSNFLGKWSWLQRKPVIFVDEMPGQNKKEELEFMRNLCRSLGLTVILSGTNSRAVNMLNTDSSRIESTPYLWCHLFPRPSPPTVISLKASRVPKYDQILAKCNEIHPTLSDFVSKCCVTCRGFFVLAMMRHLEVTLLGSVPTHPQSVLSPLEVMDDLMAVMQATVLQKKNSIFKTQVGRSGQVLMYFSGIKCASEVISKHFAYLYLQRRDAAEEESGGLELRFWRKDGIVVEESHKDFPLTATKLCGNIYPHPYSFFPTIECEPLLFLSLCANYKCQFSFLDENREGIPLCQAWLNPELHAQIQIHVKTQTERSTKSDGSILEQYAGVAIAAASHCGGLQGQKVLPFLTALVYHLYGSRCSDKFERLAKKRSIIPKSMQDMKIPFLSPTDDIFPPSLKAIPGVNVVELVRTDDQSQIDMKAGSCLIVEAKDRKTFRASDVETVLRKFNHHATPAEPQLWLIFQKVMNKDPYVLQTRGPIFQLRVDQTAEGTGDLQCLTPKYGSGKPLNKQGSQTRVGTDPDINVNGLCLIFEVGNVNPSEPPGRSEVSAYFYKTS
ncbi:hypothetical protein Pelo_16147 [Pelomyxa schiedti]|nr:hypothetical protein Pelo_16147 [Pelomyxa schiedti]